MKKTNILSLIIAMFLISACAGNISEDSYKTVVFQTDIHCEKCETTLFKNIPHEDGIVEMKVDVPTKLVTISFDTQKQSVKKIIKLFKDLGYTANVK